MEMLSREPRFTLTDVILQTYLEAIKYAGEADYESALRILYTAAKCMPSAVQDELREDMCKIEQELSQIEKIDNNYGFVGRNLIQMRELERKRHRLFNDFLTKFARVLDKHGLLESAKPR